MVSASVGKLPGLVAGGAGGAGSVGWRCSNTSLMTITAAKGVKCLNR